jgi:hypothetical protein
MNRLVAIVFVLAGCAGGVAVAEAETSAPSATVGRTEIRLALSLYVVVDGDDPDSGLSSVRTADEVRAIATDIGAIWAAADIVFDPVTVNEIEMPGDVLRAIAESLDTGPFFDQVGRTFDVPQPGAVNGFLVRFAGGVNGFAPDGSRVFFVVDQPSVHDERVSSHELGHLMGLRHALDDQDRLMFSGTNGMDLDEEEQVVARLGAQALLAN